MIPALFPHVGGVQSAELPPLPGRATISRGGGSVGLVYIPGRGDGARLTPSLTADPNPAHLSGAAGRWRSPWRPRAACGPMSTATLRL